MEGCRARKTASPGMSPDTTGPLAEILELSTSFISTPHPISLSLSPLPDVMGYLQRGVQLCLWREGVGEMVYSEAEGRGSERWRGGHCGVLL